MTTKELLDRAVASHNRRDVVDMLAALRQYWRQRNAGELEPNKGDQRANSLGAQR